MIFLWVNTTRKNIKCIKNGFRARYLQRMFVIFTLLLQITIIFYLLYSSSKASEIVSVMLSFISIIVAVLIAAKQDNEALCLLWIMWILAFPVFGGLMYLMFHFQSSTKSFRKMSNTIENDTRPLFFMSESSIEKALSDFPEQASAIRYLEKSAGFPIYSGTQTTYLSPGEVKFEYMLEELKKAENYIFMEYFIIQEGIMWNSILDILKEKSKQGVDVRLLYDDIGCFLTLPKDFPGTDEKSWYKVLRF